MSQADEQLTPQQRYQRTYDFWQQHKPDEYPPLSFEIPDEVPEEEILIAHKMNSLGYAHKYVDENYLLIESKRSTSNLYSIIATFLYGGGGTIAFFLITSAETAFYINLGWIIGGISVFIAILFIIASFRTKATRFNIFDRKRGKYYLFQGDDKPHLELDFYDQHFMLEKVLVGRTRINYDLELMPRWQNESGEWLVGSRGVKPSDENYRANHPSYRVEPLTFMPIFKKSTYKIWFALCRYMDPNTVFTTREELEFRESHYFKRIYKDKVLINHKDGTQTALWENDIPLHHRLRPEDCVDIPPKYQDESLGYIKPKEIKHPCGTLNDKKIRE